jgi:hypothetical protein
MKHGGNCECVPCCDADALRDNPMHQMEREERRDAQVAAESVGDYARCYRHDWASDGHGGGVCTGCPETVRAGDIQ